MYKNQKLVFSRRLTEAQVKRIEALVESTPGIFLTDVKSHSIELFVEFNAQGFIAAYNSLVTEIYKDFKIGNVIALDGEGYVLESLPATALQSDDMKKDLQDKGRRLF